MTREPCGTIKLKSPEGGGCGATKMHNSDLGPWTSLYKCQKENSGHIQSIWCCVVAVRKCICHYAMYNKIKGGADGREAWMEAGREGEREGRTGGRGPSEAG